MVRSMANHSAAARLRVGIDTGGTFTDIVSVDIVSGATQVTKVASTPANPAIGLLRGVNKILAANGATTDSVVGVGMQETDSDGADALHTEEFCRGADAFLIERAQFEPTEIQPAADFADELQRHDPFGLHPEIRIAVALRYRLPGDFKNVPEA